MEELTAALGDLSAAAASSRLAASRVLERAARSESNANRQQALGHRTATAALVKALGDGDLKVVQNAVIAVARQAREARAMAEAAKAMADETAGRAARFMRRHDAMRGVLLAALDALGTRKIEGPDVTVSLRAGRSETVITDEAQIPDAYWRTVRTLDKAALREDLKQGVVVDGAELANGLPSVTIRGN